MQSGPRSSGSWPRPRIRFQSGAEAGQVLSWRVQWMGLVEPERHACGREDGEARERSEPDQGDEQPRTRGIADGWVGRGHRHRSHHVTRVSLDRIRPVRDRLTGISRPERSARTLPAGASLDDHVVIGGSLRQPCPRSHRPRRPPRRPPRSRIPGHDAPDDGPSDCARGSAGDGPAVRMVPAASTTTVSRGAATSRTTVVRGSGTSSTTVSRSTIRSAMTEPPRCGRPHDGPAGSVGDPDRPAA